ncbi:MAG: sulfatase-like hydrolase/transferase, partial [Fimbriimonadales bacterium]
MVPALLASLVPGSLPVNIVYIMADDLGYGELGCYGQRRIPTPNIDRLAAQGVRFTRFYAASPVCAPTRCSLLTGKHQGHAAIRGNKERGGFDIRGLEGQFPLPKSEKTIAEALRSAGYATALIGKWGLGGPLPGQRPNDHGFE